MEAILPIIFLIISIWFLWWIAITVPMEMARARNRDAAGWLLVSIFGSPIAAIFFLWLLGPKSIHMQPDYRTDDDDQR
jgi:hypothetical protein